MPVILFNRVVDKKRIITASEEERHKRSPTHPKMIHFPFVNVMFKLV
jgi:hypothetical protein